MRLPIVNKICHRFGRHSFLCCNLRGVYTRGGGWCEMHHGENWGGECCDDNDAFGSCL